MNRLIPNITTITKSRSNYRKIVQKTKAIHKPLNKESKLSDLSGIWSEEEAKNFNSVIDSSFERIDLEG